MGSKRLSSILQRAERGDPQAQLDLGDLFCYGEEVTQSDEEAVKWYRKAAVQGNAEAQFALGEMCRDGLGVGEDSKQAFDWFSKSAEQGFPPAQTVVADHYFNGLEVEQSHEKAVEWYRKAAKQGDAEAQFALGEMYMDGLGVTEDPKHALHWFLKSAEQGFAPAQTAAGNFYSDGLGVEQSYETALEWYRKAADQGDAEAQCCLGEMYANGLGVARDSIEAFNWFLKSAEQGVTIAQAALGEAYQYGEGVEQSMEQALECYSKAAEQGDSDIQFFLAETYLRALGAPWNAVEALKWCSMAAEQDHAAARRTSTHMEQMLQEFGREGLNDSSKHHRVAKRLLLIPRPDEGLWPWLDKGKKASKKEANKFFLGAILDYHMQAEQVWQQTRKFAEQMLDDPDDLWEFITSFSEEAWKSKKKEFALHFLNDAHMRAWHIGKDLVQYYEGDARKIWQGQEPASVHKRLQKLGKRGAGANISNMIVGALLDTGQIEGIGDVKADTHVRRVLGRVFNGKAFKANQSAQVVELARNIYPENPWLLDQPLYFLGADACYHKEPDCEYCYLRDECLFCAQNA